MSKTIKKAPKKNPKLKGPIVDCGYCDGTGQINSFPSNPPDDSLHTCPYCKGTGKVEWDMKAEKEDSTTTHYKRLKKLAEKIGYEKALEMAADDIVALEFELQIAQDEIEKLKDES